MLILRSSSTFTVPKGVKKIDVFCVGGGGSGGFSQVQYDAYVGGEGGGGGYTSTVLGASVTPGQQLSVVVGDGGYGGTNGRGSDGGKSSVGSICNANGGSSYSNGGSGGGSYAYYLYTYGYGWRGNVGGKDGGDGEDAILIPGMVNPGEYRPTGGGKGQGTTTRYFGESNGTLYSSGGCGMFSPSNYGTSFLNFAVANTGNGGDGGGRAYCPYYGSSGICIIRWGKQ